MMTKRRNFGAANGSFQFFVDHKLGQASSLRALQVLAVTMESMSNAIMTRSYLCLRLELVTGSLHNLDARTL